MRIKHAYVHLAVWAGLIVMAPALSADDSVVTSTRILTADDCKCISVLPVVPGVKYNVTNSCEPLFVAVEFTGDILRLSPRTDAMSTWARLGPVITSSTANLGDNGWTITSIAAIALRNKTSAVSCSFADGKTEQQTFAPPGPGAPSSPPAPPSGPGAPPSPSAGPPPSPSDPDRAQRPGQLTFRFINQDSSRVLIKLYSQSRNHVWPSADESYYINGGDSDRKHVELSCQDDEKICYGAWRASDEGSYWGSGADDRHNCEHCCAVCGGDPSDHTLLPGPDRSNSFTALVRNLDRYAVELSFYANQRNNAWPGGNQIFPLRDSQYHEYSLSCVRGEKICYGAWRSGNSNIYWGVGLGGRQGCQGCCATCGDGSHRWTLNGYNGGSVSSGAGASASDFLNALTGAIELGSAIAGSRSGSGPSQGGAVPYGNWSGRRSNNNQSDITGTKR